MSNHTRDHSDRFYASLDRIADELRCAKVDLLGAMNAESGVSARARNPRSSATGLIQFMAPHYERWGFTRDQFASMPADAQIEYVLRYMKPHVGKLPNAGAIYTAVFLPAFVDQAKDLDYVLCARADTIRNRLAWAYAANAVFDANGDGRITVRELVEAIQRNWAGPRCAEMLVRAGLDRVDAPWIEQPADHDLRTTLGIQRALLAHGYSLGAAGADGIPGPLTRGALLQFQTDHGLQIDGVVGPKTRAALAA